MGQWPRKDGGMVAAREGEGRGREGGLGRVIIFSQEFPHLKSSLGAASLYICSLLLHHAAAACGCVVRLVCVCVCGQSGGGGGVWLLIIL